MQDSQLNLPRTTCPGCGKIVPRRDIRDTKPQYCGRRCAGLARFATRYRGSQSGPFDRPLDITAKTKWPAAPKSDLISDIPTGA